MNAISYVRFSTPEQSKGTSYQRQIEATEAYCAKHDLTLMDDGKFFDEGISAFTGENKRTGQLADILDRVNNGKIPPGTRLIVENLDRLGRDNLMSQLGIFTRLLNAGIHIVTLGDSPKEYAPGSGLPDFMLALMQMELAHDESRKKAERLSAAWKIKRENLDKTPLTSTVPYWIQKRGNNLFLIPERAAVIQQIFEMALNGLGRRVIAKTLNENEVAVFGSAKRNKANLWRDSYIAKILNNRSTFGEFQPHQKHGGKRTPVGEPMADYFPAAISEQTFLAVQARMKERAGRGGRSIHKAQNLFSSRLRCWHCGGPMHFQNKGSGPKNPNNLKYVVCDNKFFGKTCDAPTVQYDALEKTILRELTQIDWPALINGKAKPLGDETAAMQGQIAELERKIDNLLNVFADGTVSEALTARLTQFETEKTLLVNSMKKLKAETDSKNQSRRMSLEAAAETEKFLAMAKTPDLRQKLKKSIGDLMQKSYVAAGEGKKFHVAMMLTNGGFGLVNGDFRFKYERGGEGPGLQESLEALLDKPDLAKLRKWEPKLLE